MSSIIFICYIISSVFIIIYSLYKYKEQRILHLDAMSKFVAFMVLVSMYRLCVLPPDFVSPIPNMKPFLFVFLEDAFFVMIPYYICKKIQKNSIQILVWLIFSLIFASGHMYQGLLAAFFTGLYPYFISRTYALRTSFITVMACHFIYDCMTFLTIQINKIIQFL